MTTVTITRLDVVFAVRVRASTPDEFRRALGNFKESIPALYRRYEPSEKCWYVLTAFESFLHLWASGVRHALGAHVTVECAAAEAGADRRLRDAAPAAFCAAGGCARGL